jgi:serine/threonine-protein kinase
VTTKRPESLLWQRWGEVDRLLSDALDLPAERRAEYIRDATGDDAELRALVMRLLERIERSDQQELFPGHDVVLAAFASESLPAEAEALPPGSTVGRYRVVQRIGRGGMATVYEAERADGAYQQRVALKVLRRGLDTEDLVRRFVAERQILSSLSHPNIARLLDGGATEAGLPFLVMELVQGEPITRWADGRRLDVRARLRLFLDVAAAVSAAHRRLVVHRDIKPSNVLVDAEGRVKLLDFGIAKLLDRDDDITRTGSAALTPEYASPEQLDGGVITTGTDVYQLGLLLRELLTGLPPHAGVANTDDPPLRPSRAAHVELHSASTPRDRAHARSTTPDELGRALQGDLDIILGKANRPEVEERFATVDEMAADIRRFLEGRPIAAHAESKTYRFRKFVTRHRWFLPATAATVLALVSLVVQDVRVRRERDAAEVARERALAIQQFLVDMLRSADPTTSAATIQSPDLTVGEVLRRGRTRIDGELSGQPQVKAEVLVAMGRTYTGIGQWATADSLLRESLGLLAASDGAGSPSTASPILALADNFRVQREFRQADSLFHVAIHLLDDGTPDQAFASLLGATAGTQRDLGSPDSAIALANRALRVHSALGDSTSQAYLTSLSLLGLALRGAQQLDSAETIYRLVIERMANDSSAMREHLAVHHNNLGYVLRLREDYSGAEVEYRKALEITTEVLGPGHLSTMLVRQNLARTLELVGRLDDAIAIAREQIAAAEARWPEGHWRVGDSYLGLGRAMVRNGRAADGVPLIEAGIRSFAETIGPNHEWTNAARADLGGALLLSGDAVRGERVLTDALSALAKLDGRLSPDARAYLGRLASVLEPGEHADLAAPIRSLLAKNPS